MSEQKPLLSTLAIDISGWQPKLDAQTLREAGVELVILKSSEGLATDSCFRDNAKRLLDGGIRIAAYHFIRFGIDPTLQAKYCLGAIAGWPLEFIAGDIERHYGKGVNAFTPKHVDWHAKTFMSVLAGQDCYRPVVYTNEGTINTYSLGSWMQAYPSWLAAYLFRWHPEQRIKLSWDDLKQVWTPPVGKYPFVPPNAGKLCGWQWSGDRFVLPGVWGDTAGKRDTCLDVNLFDAKWLGFGNTPVIPVPAPKEANTAKSATVTATVLNVRTGPGATYQIVAALYQGDQVKIAGEKYGWGRLADSERWISLDWVQLGEVASTPVRESDTARTGTVIATILNVRSGPGTSYADVGDLKQGSTVKIAEVKAGWGRLADTKTWVSMDWVRLN